jgi:hypothetical protein
MLAAIPLVAPAMVTAVVVIWRFTLARRVCGMAPALGASELVSRSSYRLRPRRVIRVRVPMIGRWRGEKFSAACADVPTPGRSPPARGRACRPDGGGSDPERAGSTTRAGGVLTRPALASSCSGSR